MDLIAASRLVVGGKLELPYSSQEYFREADAMQVEWPQSVWHREGKPGKISLGPRSKPEDWAKFQSTCPKTLETAERLLLSLADQAVHVSFGDILDYRGGNLLGWHQDNMDVTRHTFTVVLTLAAEGDGRFEWCEILDGGCRLGSVIASSRPAAGDLAIHGITCNNALAHRIFWDTGRRVTLVLFCRSLEMEGFLCVESLQSNLTMRHWWSKEFDIAK